MDEKLIQEIKDAHKNNTGVEKIHKTGAGNFLKDFVYGANDGIITTFAVVAGVAGAQLSAKIVVILGVANLIADGLSMAAGNYLGTKSENDFQKKEREMEELEIKVVPEEEKKEVKEIYKQKGFKGQDLDRAVQIITSDKKQWVDEMMIHELGIVPGEEDNPLANAVVTFVAFVIAGALPLLPYIFGIESKTSFSVAIITTAVALFIIGSLRSIFTKKNWFISGLEMLGVGAIAAIVAYALGAWIESLVTI